VSLPHDEDVGVHPFCGSPADSHRDDPVEPKQVDGRGLERYPRAELIVSGIDILALGDARSHIWFDIENPSARESYELATVRA
jgi:hypothetical protein